ncbi:hypothetical protein [Desulfovibrio legallii]|uniref:hypothetical protein n=1 Tax=Desulfovibrio legallii TaxID=571438 RepID=UPI001177E9BE|nr:hypothetical protein [Desulfovibrio legallii]
MKTLQPPRFGPRGRPSQKRKRRFAARRNAGKDVLPALENAIFKSGYLRHCNTAMPWRLREQPRAVAA